MAEAHISEASLYDDPAPGLLAGDGGISVSVDVGVKVRAEKLGKPGEEGAALIGQIVTSVGANLSEKYRIDVMNTLEFATRVANRARKDSKGLMSSKEWNDKFAGSITQIGWAQQYFREHEVKLDQSTLGNSFVDLVKKTILVDDGFTAEQKKTIVTALDKMIELQKHTRALDKVASDDKDVQFGVVAATETNGALAMRFIGFHFTASEDIKDVLLFKFNDTKIDISTTTLDLAGNQATIDRLRKTIENRMYGTSEDYILNVPI
ncbi:hypothetical protein BD779DRAFT_1003053 [Infundibulicybe gibba]|nr:hypothetical protein BD779DRAFT_1003053 [Infundibulicybe gibba]